LGDAQRLGDLFHTETDKKAQLHDLRLSGVPLTQASEGIIEHEHIDAAGLRHVHAVKGHTLKVAAPFESGPCARVIHKDLAHRHCDRAHEVGVVRVLA